MSSITTMPGDPAVASPQFGARLPSQHLYRPHPKLGIATRTEPAGFDLES
jgi:hypothetical protein